MNKAKFDELIGNPKVFKGIGNTSGLWHYEEDDIIISWMYAHQGHPVDFPENTGKLIVNVFPFQQLTKGIPVFPMEGEKLVIVNADNEEFALTYQFSIDSKNRTVNVIVKDLPEIDAEAITDEEKDGLQFNY